MNQFQLINNFCLKFIHAPAKLNLSTLQSTATQKKNECLCVMI